MIRSRPLLTVSERWFRLLLRFYPVDFRDEMGGAVVEAYKDRAREALSGGGITRLASVWLHALFDALRNGPGERFRPAVSWRRSGDWGRDIELVTRRLRRAPAFAGATLATLTLGLGMFAVVYTVVHNTLIAPMPYRDPDDLYYVWRDYGPIVDLKKGALAGTDVAELQKAGGVIEGAVGLERYLGGVFSVREDTDPMEIAVTRCSPALFDLLGATPALGRSFAPSEVGPGSPLVIVLTHELWRRIGADPGIVGRDVRLNGRPFTVVGVMPPGFRFVRHEPGPAQRVDAYVTFAVDLAATNPKTGGYAGLVRARRGSAPEEVEAAVEAVGRAVDARDFAGRGLRLYPVGLQHDLVARVRPALLVLAAAGVVLALMLAVNLASVLLARAAQREHEVAIYRALGANDLAVMRAMLLEGGVLGLLGGALGALVAVWGTRALVAVAPLDLPRRESIAVDWSIAGAVLLVGMLLGVIAASVPAVWAARRSLSSLLASSAVRGGGGHARLRRGMIVTQVALSLILLSSGGLVVRSFDRLLRADPGFKPEGLFTVKVRAPPEFFPKPADAAAFQQRVLDALDAIPGVTAVGAANALPLTAAASGQTTITMPGAPGNTGDSERDALLVDFIAARAGYPEVMGMRLLAGRTFETSRPKEVREAIVDDTLARRFFPGASPLGAKMAFEDKSLTIIGVVKQARLYDVHEDGRPQVYVRAEDMGFRALFYVVRTERKPQTLLPEVQAAVRQVDTRVAVGDPRTMEQIVGNTLRQQKTSAALITAFAVGALLLAAMGLFGVVSGSVTRRRHELAVRLSLGADYRRVLRLVVREGALLVGIGVLIALPGIYAAGRLIRGVLVGVSPLDPLTLLAVTIGLALVTLLTCYLPARRVLKIEPSQLLRQE